jgi:hypothetical protein
MSATGCCLMKIMKSLSFFNLFEYSKSLQNFPNYDKVDTCGILLAKTNYIPKFIILWNFLSYMYSEPFLLTNY